MSSQSDENNVISSENNDTPEEKKVMPAISDTDTFMFFVGIDKSKSPLEIDYFIEIPPETANQLIFECTTSNWFQNDEISKNVEELLTPYIDVFKVIKLRQCVENLETLHLRCNKTVSRERMVEIVNRFSEEDMKKATINI